MFRIQAPYPAPQTTIIMPSGQLGNNRGLTSSIQTMRAMDGTLYTYIKTKRGRKVHSWDFIVTKSKANELKEFTRRYAGSVVVTTDHNGQSLIGYLTMNPLDMEGQGRAGGYPSGEVYRVSIQLEEKV